MALPYSSIPPPPPPLAFRVKRHDPQLIVPAETTTHEFKPLSDLDDQEGLRFQLPFLLFYPNRAPTTRERRKDPVRVVKEALAKALVYYYPLAGRIREGPNRKLTVDCTGEGILFVEADASVGLAELGDSVRPPCAYVDDILHDVPGYSGIVGCPLMLVQLTRLRCGGFILAVRVNHTIADSLGLLQFLTATSELARGARAPSHLPVWHRDILCARDPPLVTCAHHEYSYQEEGIDTVDEGSSPNPTLLEDPKQMVHESFFFGPTQMASIKNHLPQHVVSKCSTFDVLTACLWRCRTAALRLDSDAVVHLTCMINARGRTGLKVPDGYYGNSSVHVLVSSKVGRLLDEPLIYALELVKAAKRKVNEEFTRSSIDFLATNGRPKHITACNFLVADSTKVGFKELDFGWGKPTYGGVAGGFPLISFYVGHKDGKGEEGIVVPIWLPRRAMMIFRDELTKMADVKNVRDPDGLDSSMKVVSRL